MIIPSELNRFIIRDGELSVPMWEWSTRERTLLGHRIRTVSTPEMIMFEWYEEHPSPIPGGTPGYTHERRRRLPVVEVTFENHWAFNLGFDDYETIALGWYVAPRAFVSVYSHRTGWREELDETLEDGGTLAPSELESVIHEVAGRERWEPSAPLRREWGIANLPDEDISLVDADDATLIRHFIRPAPPSSGSDGPVLDGYGIPVSTIVQATITGANIGKGADEVAREHRISLPALRAALLYHLRHRPGSDVFGTVHAERESERPVPTRSRGGFGSARGYFITSHDFDDPLPEFAEYR